MRVSTGMYIDLSTHADLVAYPIPSHPTSYSVLIHPTTPPTPTSSHPSAQHSCRLSNNEHNMWRRQIWPACSLTITPIAPFFWQVHSAALLWAHHLVRRRWYSLRPSSGLLGGQSSSSSQVQYRRSHVSHPKMAGFGGSTRPRCGLHMPNIIGYLHRSGTARCVRSA